MKIQRYFMADYYCVFQKAGVKYGVWSDDDSDVYFALWGSSPSVGSQCWHQVHIPCDVSDAWPSTLKPPLAEQ